MREFGQMVRAAREQQGWTQDELADRVGVSRATVSRWETGDQMPVFAEQFNSIVLALGLSAESTLRALGVHIAPAGITRLPRELQEALLAMTPEQHAALLAFVRPLVATERDRR